jgi:hypothetical protein
LRRNYSGREFLWAFTLSVSFLLSVFAAFRGGFVSPDYWIHLPRLIDSSRVFDFSTTSPPIYYLFGHAVFLLIGNSNASPITLSIVQAAINTPAMWWFFSIPNVGCSPLSFIWP